MMRSSQLSRSQYNRSDMYPADIYLTSYHLQLLIGSQPSKIFPFTVKPIGDDNPDPRVPRGLCSCSKYGKTRVDSTKHTRQVSPSPHQKVLIPALSFSRQ